MKKLLFILTILISVTAFSQAPQAMSYQAVIRDNADNLISNQNVGIQISIIEVGVGTIAYVETQTPMTNANGLVSLKIGEGNVQSGVFAVINWAGANYEIKTEIDVAGGTNYTVSGTSQLLSVPYSFYAVSSGGDISVLKDADGDTQIQVEESPNENIIRFDMAGTEKWVMKNNALEQLNSGESLFIGQDAGANDDLLDNKNVFLGFGSGFLNISGDQNVAVGHNTLVFNSTGSDNTAVGFNALYTNGTGTTNVAVGSNALYSNNTGSSNVAVGRSVLNANDSGQFNTAIGAHSLAANTIGNLNVAAGGQALFTNIDGDQNVAIGYRSLFLNTEGNNNTAVGYQSLNNNTEGQGNVALGNESLFSNISGNNNNAIGENSLYSNTSGNNNNAMGINALNSNTTGPGNIAIGINSLYSNVAGGGNIALGGNALYSNTNATSNIAIGDSSLSSNISGLNNVAIGPLSLQDSNGTGNVAVGYEALNSNTDGFTNTAVGHRAFRLGVSYSNSTAIGYNTAISGSNQIHLGNTSISAIRGQVAFSTYSDGRIKDNVTEDVPGLDFVLKLRPVTYNLNVDKQNKLMGVEDDSDYEEKYNSEDITRTGFIAQEVEKAAQEINYDFSGVQVPKIEKELYSLSYAEFVVPLVKAIQEQQKEIKALQNKINQQDNQINSLSAEAVKVDDLQSQIDALKQLVFEMK